MFVLTKFCGHGYNDLCYNTHDIIIFYYQSAPSMAQVAAALVSAASILATNTDRLVEARSSNNPSSSRSWEKQPKFLQDQILHLMAGHEDNIVNDPIQSLATFLSLSSNTSATPQFMAEYLQSILNCQDLRLDPFTTLYLSQLQFNYDPTEGPLRISLFKLLSESSIMVSSSDIEIFPMQQLMPLAMATATPRL